MIQLRKQLLTDVLQNSSFENFATQKPSLEKQDAITHIFQEIQFFQNKNFSVDHWTTSEITRTHKSTRKISFPRRDHSFSTFTKCAYGVRIRE